MVLQFLEFERREPFRFLGQVCSDTLPMQDCGTLGVQFPSLSHGLIDHGLVLFTNGDLLQMLAMACASRSDSGRPTGPMFSKRKLGLRYLEVVWIAAKVPSLFTSSRQSCIEHLRPSISSPFSHDSYSSEFVNPPSSLSESVISSSFSSCVGRSTVQNVSTPMAFIVSVQ